ncbi:MAG: anthranilate phosphoribosyltransferase [Candidatus Omnitrophica bacterium]|nr:anthranilate phosphoribosyltransferase [Candidatus Omnitrophota bacterium]MCM8830795.1 anthranilate phosphoribosyltransferase [Candidatus Omnitrophota bacterium]
MIKEAILKLINGKNLSFGETKIVFCEILDNKISPEQIASFLTAFSIKTPTQQEITAAATVIRSKAIKLKILDEFMGCKIDEPIVDTCGTGGSSVNKFNISTTVAFVISASGIKVAKHGNRAMSSSCGSADLLEELGIKIDINPEIMQEAIKKIGIGFLYAPLYHPALKEVARIRRLLGFRTIFNILGPLCNPVCVTHQLLGVYKKELLNIIANVLKNLGVKKAFVVYSDDLKDEVSLSSKTTVNFLNKKRIEKFTINASSFGLKKIRLKDVEAKNVKESAEIFKQILEGRDGPYLDVVCANASCCFFILGKARNLKEGVNLARHLIKEGLVKKKFEEFKNFIAQYKDA